MMLDGTPNLVSPRLVASMALLAFHGLSFAAPQTPRPVATAAAVGTSAMLMPRGETLGDKGGDMCFFVFFSGNYPLVI